MKSIHFPSLFQAAMMLSIPFLPFHPASWIPSFSSPLRPGLHSTICTKTFESRFAFLTTLPFCNTFPLFIREYPVANVLNKGHRAFLPSAPPTAWANCCAAASVKNLEAHLKFDVAMLLVFEMPTAQHVWSVEWYRSNCSSSISSRTTSCIT